MPTQKAYSALSVVDVATFDSPDAPPEASGQKWIFGAWVAMTNQCRLMMRHGLLGSLDIFTPNVIEIKPFRLAGRSGRRLPPWRLPAEARKRRYDAILAEATSTEEWSVRERLSPGSSVVAFTHSMNYQVGLLQVGHALLWDLYRPYDAVICSSPTARSTWLSMLDRVSERIAPFRSGPVRTRPKVSVIPFGTDLPAPCPDRRASRRALGLRDDEVVVLSFGRLSNMDKADYAALLVPLARLVRRARPLRVKVIIAGEDAAGMAAVLRKLAAGLGLGRSLEVHGDVPDAARIELYRCADIFLAPSDNLQETFGLTVMDAMSFGLPVVASDWGGYRDLVRPGKTGLLIRTLWTGDLSTPDALGGLRGYELATAAEVAQRTCVDVDDMEACLLSLVRDAGLRRRMGEQGRARIAAEYSWETVIGRHRELWDELAALRAKGRAKSRPARELPATHDHAGVFGHYPNETLRPGQRVRLTPPAGVPAASNPLFAFLPEGRAEAVAFLLRSLGKGPSSASSLCAAAVRRFGVTSEDAKADLVLAAKYGLVSILPGSRKGR